MAERYRRLTTASHLRSLLPAVLLLAPALAVAAILADGLSDAGRQAVAESAGKAQSTDRGTTPESRRASTVTIGWVGDITPGSQYGLPANGGAGLFAKVGRTMREPDLMAGNLEGTLS